MATILCVDDEPAIRVVLEHALTKLGHRPLLSEGTDEAIATMGRTSVDLILADYRMPKATGLDLLARCKELGYDIPMIMMTAYSSIEHAVISIRSGAVDYLTKPIRNETLDIAITQALEVAKLRRQNEAFRKEIAEFRSTREIVGDSDGLQAVMRTIAMVAPTRATVLLLGESGTGKELFARAIHDQSPRHDQPFVSLNCAALPEGLVESALFGHEKGAFTGATARTPGAFERAHRGTLLLDEISEMRLDLQAKLLRVVQEQEFERVGGKHLIQVDVRIIATTNQDLKAEVAAGRFRNDLYYRLNVVPLKAPSLRQRLDDVPLLVHHFLRRAAKELGVPTAAVSPEALAILQSYAWPGNVRELANLVERAVILSPDGTIGPQVFRSYLEEDVATGATKSGETVRPVTEESSAETLNLRDLEKVTIERALVTTNGNRTRAAKLLGISERTLRNKLNVPKAPE
jgi:DNA-binding NtrC family response regulator